MKKALRTVGLAFCVLAAFLVGLELLLRILTPEVIRDIPMDRSFRLYGPEHTRQHPHSGFSTNVQHIAVVGDSITMGAGNHRFDRFATRLEWLLNLNDGVPPIEVEVFAKPTATYQQSRLLEKALDYNPSLVIFVVHLNDTEDWSAAQVFLKLREAMGLRVLPHAFRPLAEHSALVRQIWRREEEARQERAMIKYYDFLYADHYSGMVKFQKALPRFRDLCAQHHATMIVVLFPLLNVDHQPGRYPFERMHAIVRGICDKDGIPFLDLLDAYRSADASRVENILLLDGHPNEIGHRIAADAIFDFLLDQKLVDASYRPRRSEDPGLILKWQKKLRVMNKLFPAEQNTTPP